MHSIESRFPRRWKLVVALVATAVFSLGADGGCNETIRAAAEAVPDFRGNYLIDHDDQVSVTLVLGGAEYREDGIQGQVIDVGGVEIDMDEVCDLDGVHCPSEIYWSDVGIDQPYYDNADGENPWLIQVVNLNHQAHQLQVGGLVNSKGDMTLLLGLDVQGVPPCGLLGASVSTADFELDDLGEPTGSILNGRIKTVYAGACLFPTDDAMLGATITFETTFTGERTGNLDLPDSVSDTPAFDEDGNPI